MDADVDETDPFDAWYGVVLTYEHGGGPLRWSRGHRAWMRRRQRGDWLDWVAEPVDGDDVDADEYAAALLVADRFLESQWCPRCLAEPRAETHFIALDVLGEPEVYCVQRPAYEIVGGSGTIVGPLLGSGIVLALRNWVSSFFELHAAVMGLVFIAVVLWAPNGLVGLLASLRANRRAAR